MMSDRIAILRQGIGKADRVLEIGPSFNPVAPKREGWTVFSVDHADQNGLVGKYRNDPSVNIALIEPVDFVWTGGALSDAVPTEHHGTFDVFLASHVIEHAPDLLAFLRSAEVLVREAGKMVLAIPDKRVCFDFFRPLATTGDVLVAHRERRSRHSRKSLWDYSAYQVKKNDSPGWGRDDQATAVFSYTLAQAAALSERCESKEYIDAHAWTFVPSSFALIMLELSALNLTDWQVERIEAAEYTEFYVWLRRGARARTGTMPEADLAAERLRLLNETMLDLDDQGQQLAESRANRLQNVLDQTRPAVAAKQEQVIHGLIARQQAMEAELLRVQNAMSAVRSSRAWRVRSTLRRVLRLPPTPADGQVAAKGDRLHLS
jgi:hypothetical protein